MKPQKAEKEWKTKIGTKNEGNNKKYSNKMVDANPTASIITLNVNGLNTSTKRFSEWFKNKGEPTMCGLQEPHFKCKDID